MTCCNGTEPGCTCGGAGTPAVISNPPGLSAISYRVGDYTAFRRALLQNLPGETELSGMLGTVTTPIWRPGGRGDLALQMMEWWAYLADILTFYNQRIANQAYLGTADLPESVSGLVKLLGYRPRPGLGATGTLAALSNSPLRFMLPAGFAVQSKPGPGQAPQVFEVGQNTMVGSAPAGPLLPAQILGAIGVAAGAAQMPVTINGDGTSTLVMAGTSLAVKKGDQVLIVPAAFTSSSGAVATVTGINPGTDPTLGAITTLGVDWVTDSAAVTDVASLELYRGGQPAQVWQYPADPARVVVPATSGSTGWTVDLQSIVRAITPGDLVLYQTATAAFQACSVTSTVERIWYANPAGYTPGGSTAGVDPSVPPATSTTVSTTVTATNTTTETVTNATTTVIAIPISHTSVTMAVLPAAGVVDFATAIAAEAARGVFVRTFDLGVEAAKPLLAARLNIGTVRGGGETQVPFGNTFTEGMTDPLPSPVGAANVPAANVSGCCVWHSWILAGSLIALPPATVGGSAAPVTVAPIGGNTFTQPGAGGSPAMVADSVGTGAAGVVNSANTLTLTGPVPLLIPPLTAYVNLLNVSRGKTVPNEVLGSGDATLAGQDFTLKNGPVTYLQDSASVSGQGYSSTIGVWVNGLQWTEVQSFFGQPAGAQVFVTREDASGATHVVFGDGAGGARLPTGSNNVTATYRYGSGAAAPAAGSLTVVLKPQPGLRSIANPVAAGGGSDPDAPSKIRQLAPKSVLTFGRAVSADDFQVIAAQASGVTRAAAAFGFDPVQQRPVVTVWVGDTPAAVANAIAAIAGAADPNRLPIVVPATAVNATLSLSIVVGPQYPFAAVQSAVEAALLDPDGGLLGVNNVGIGQVFYDSEIYAVCMAVPGVSAVRDLRFIDGRYRFRDELLLRFRPIRFPVLDGTRYDPGAGNFYFLPDDGSALTINQGAA